MKTGELNLLGLAFPWLKSYIEEIVKDKAMRYEDWVRFSLRYIKFKPFDTHDFESDSNGRILKLNPEQKDCNHLVICRSQYEVMWHMNGEKTFGRRETFSPGDLKRLLAFVGKFNRIHSQDGILGIHVDCIVRLKTMVNTLSGGFVSEGIEIFVFSGDSKNSHEQVRENLSEFRMAA